MLDSLCGLSHTMRLFYIFKIVVNIICVITPLIIMYKAFATFLPLVISGENPTEGLKGIGKSLVAGFIIFLIPSGLNAAFTLTATGSAAVKEIQACYKDASLQKVNSMIEAEKKAAEIQRQLDKDKNTQAFKNREAEAAALNEALNKTPPPHWIKQQENANNSTPAPNVNYSNLSMTDYPHGDSREEGLARAVIVAKYLAQNGDFTKEQAAAMAGVYLDENNCNPGGVMEAEAAGQGVSGTGGSGYGAGIASWTFVPYKQQCLKDAGFDPNTPIESLTLQQQCDMVIAQSQKSNKVYYDALRRCNTIEDASATAVIITGGVGFSNNWDTHPTPAEAKAMSDYYGASNDRNFGASPYHWNADVRRLENAKEILAKM